MACVVFNHASAPFIDHIGFVLPWHIGRFGVLLFFVHTSLVLMQSLERLERDEDITFKTLTFYVRRGLRIYPLAIAAVCIVVALHLPNELQVSRTQVLRPATFDLRTILANALLIQNLVAAPLVLYQLWTLPLELQMYLTLPWFFRQATRGVWRVVALLGVTATMAALGDHLFALPGLWRLNILPFVPCFLSGVLAYAILRRRPKPIVGAWAILGLLLGGLLLSAASNLGTGFHRWGWLPCVGVGASLPFIVDARDSWFTRAAEGVAKYSYGIYLLHTFALYLAFQTGMGLPLALQWVIFTTSLCAMTWVAYHAIEAPFVRYGKAVRVQRWMPASITDGMATSGD